MPDLPSNIFLFIPLISIPLSINGLKLKHVGGNTDVMSILCFLPPHFESIYILLALLATTVAEYFRDQGKKVVLFLDSITRYARALRDVALAAGEAPARRGYPASVFDALPAVLERPGNTKNGSITAFYTILLESDEEPDPIADEIRSILDGHIYLSRKLAVQNHYPAIDVLRSVSRVSGQVSSREHQLSASEIRSLLAKIEELQMLLDLGEYTKGENAQNDRAIAKRDALLKWLQQDMHENAPIDKTLQVMNALTK